MFIQTKKGQGVIESFFLWFFTTFLYVVVGYDVLKGILDSLLADKEGLWVSLASFIPFMLFLILAFWGYTILRDTGLVGSQGGIEQ